MEAPVTLDPDLLDKVHRTAADVAEAERQALVARAEYHTAIRRLHLAGGPLREIAKALSMSHQRVQQIVSASGGSWWRRAWSSRNANPDAICTWCERPPSEVSKLVAGPRVFICDRCLGQAERALADPHGAADGLEQAPKGGRERCAFCRRRPDEERAVVTGPTANICSECMRISREFMSGHAA
jgi:hypothetical protein